ncbi:PPE family protein [Mycobacterium servetii]|uniref:PPE family protein n=1 Tax=Mycobacterium servetii TaxID=3237418 RepID=A0ABV4CE96_9MYCO
MLPTPIYHAAPPEVHSTLLNYGGTSAGIAAAGASWTALAGQYQAGVAELSAILGQVSGVYSGPSAEQFLRAHTPMLAWLEVVAGKSAAAALAHETVVMAYETAVATMPTLAELMTNHVVHGVLVGTNFLGCNTIPIGLNEADYARMWIQAGDVMLGWDSASSAASDSIPMTPTSPFIIAPGVGEGGSAAADAAGAQTVGEGQLAGSGLTAADLMSTKLMVGKAATGPSSLADGASASPGDGAENTATDVEGTAQLLGSSDGFSSALSPLMSVGSSAGQAVTSTTQAPAQLLSSVPSLLSSAPQTLSGMLSGISGANPSAAATPLGFAGTTAMRGINPAGLTTLAGGAFGSGPGRPLTPSTWGATPAEDVASTRSPAPVGGALPGGATPGGAGAGGAMMGPGARKRRTSERASHASGYPEDAVVDESDDEAVGVRGPL